MGFNFLNSKALKPVLAALLNQFGFEGKLDGFFHKNNQEKIYFASRDIALVDFEKHHTKAIGIYIAEFKEGEIRLSIEGSQIIGPFSTKNIIELDKPAVAAWMHGEDIPYSGELVGYVLIRHGSDFMGCGRVSKERIFNFIPKGRRVKIIS